MKDEILAELWEAKDAIGRTHSYNIDELFAFFKAAERQSPYHADSPRLSDTTTTAEAPEAPESADAKSE